jgi:glutathione S-transferase
VFITRCPSINQPVRRNRYRAPVARVGWLVGGHCSPVEVCYTPFVAFLPLMEVDAPPAVAAWVARMLAGPSATATTPNA